MWSDVRTEAEIRTNMFSEVAADEINFLTGGSERIRIIADGKVGIGTTGP